jgi:uncharacterized protein YgfB (UPF0149 family)
MYTISFVDAERALLAVDAGVTIAEGHGCLCGALCALPQFSSQNWLQELLPDPTDTESLAPAALPDPILIQLHDETQAALRGDDMEFAPLLPDDDVPLIARIAALAEWSQGFLYGFGIGATSSMADYPEDISEILKDLSEIARADDVDAATDDDDEDAYIELVEYLRAAVQLIHDELFQQRALQAQQQPLAH